MYILTLPYTYNYKSSGWGSAEAGPSLEALEQRAANTPLPFISQSQDHLCVEASNIWLFQLGRYSHTLCTGMDIRGPSLTYQRMSSWQSS